MDDNQRAQTGMHEKVNEVLTSNAVALSGVAEVAVKNGELKTQIDTTLLKAGLSKADTTGAAVQKGDVRTLLEKKILKVGTAAASHFHTIGNLTNERKVDFKKSEVEEADGNKLYGMAKLLFGIADPIKLLLVAYNSGPADVSTLNILKESFFGQIQDPKLATEEKGVYNKEADESIIKGNAICEELDIYMGNFAETEPTIYGLYLAARKQDNTGADAPAQITQELTIAPNTIVNIDISAITTPTGSNAVKLTVTGVTLLLFGFAVSPTSQPPTMASVSPGNALRRTFASLNFNAANRRFLNIVNTSGVAGNFKVEVF